MSTRKKGEQVRLNENPNDDKANANRLRDSMTSPAMIKISKLRRAAETATSHSKREDEPLEEARLGESSLSALKAQRTLRTSLRLRAQVAEQQQQQ